ncbi:hypothetical protein AVEN_65254-1 [Araneus ventricosus]|uniref:Uncharacterized protein n=1 Tax=Araneus ventricosus TaxID=182803 RepID=A0A4Y2AHI8_ARAVE|nr:hypothetical protein AVEN_65254-1 [Araneus ventricosus]
MVCHLSLVQLYLCPVLKQHEGDFGTDSVILNRGQMTRTTPEPESLSPNFQAIPAEGYLTTTDLMCTRPAYTAVLWCFELRSRDFTTSPLGMLA